MKRGVKWRYSSTRSASWHCFIWRISFTSRPSYTVDRIRTVLLGGWVGPRVGLVFWERKIKRSWLPCWESNLASSAVHSPQSTFHTHCKQHTDYTFWLWYWTKTIIIIYVAAYFSRCVAGESASGFWSDLVVLWKASLRLLFVTVESYLTKVKGVGKVTFYVKLTWKYQVLGS
jgi:hypothetical protein